MKALKRQSFTLPFLRLLARRVCLESVPLNKELIAVQMMEGSLKIV
jgi:hypothetical protein